MLFDSYSTSPCTPFPLSLHSLPFHYPHPLVSLPPSTIFVSQRIEQFARARPPGIYKEEYIQALFDSYHERRPEEVSCPSTPEWKRAFDLDLDLNVALNAVDDDDGVGEGEGLVKGKDGKEVSEWRVMPVDYIFSGILIHSGR